MDDAGLPAARRTRDADSTKARILAAARRAFSQNGFKAVGVREITAMAGCDATLVRRYFGSKERLFEAALAETLDVTALIEGPRESFGARAVGLFLSDSLPGNPMPMLIFSTSDPVSRAIALRLIQQQVIGPIARWLAGDHGEEKAAHISMLCSGFFLYWRILPLEVLADEVPAGTKTWLAAQLQTIADAA